MCNYAQIYYYAIVKADPIQFFSLNETSFLFSFTVLLPDNTPTPTEKIASTEMTIMIYK